jgi:hypothetical protein
MATKPTPTEAASKPVDYVVTHGVLVTRTLKGANVEVGPGEIFKPADDEERDSLLKSGRIAPAGSFAVAGSTSAQAAGLEAAVARADAADARATDLQAQLDTAKTRIAELEAKLGPAATVAPAPAA